MYDDDSQGSSSTSSRDFEKSTPSSSNGQVVFRNQNSIVDHVIDSTSELMPEIQKYVVINDYAASTSGELTLSSQDVVQLSTKYSGKDGYWLFKVNGRIGLFPANNVHLLGEVFEFHSDNITFEAGKGNDWDQVKIGQGATADVFRVLCNGKKAALKKYTRHNIEKNNYDVLRKEALLISKLNHPNIVGLVGICLEQPFVGLLMELCEGSSLRSVYRMKSSVDESRPRNIQLRMIVHWAKQIAQGMEFLSARNFVHRDLKCDNVLVKEEVCKCEDDAKFEWCPRCGRRPLDRLSLKITDFGVTKQITNDAQSRNSAVGTYAWLAPEAFRDNTYSEASDVWSFGVILWELLSREEPFKNQFALTIAFRVCNEGQQLEIADDWPLKWKEMMQMCWSLDPSLRPSFHDLVDYFGSYAKEVEISEELEHQLQRVQSVISKDLQDFVNKCSKAQKEELSRIRDSLYAPIVGERHPRRHGGRNGNGAIGNGHHHAQKLKKEDISGPIDAKHIASVQVANKNVKNAENKKDLRFTYYNDPPTGGTLPRAAARPSKTSSASFPDLNLEALIDNINAVNQGSNKTLERKQAVRRKSTGRPSITIQSPEQQLGETRVSEEEPPSYFANIEYADDTGSTISSKSDRSVGQRLKNAFGSLVPFSGQGNKFKRNSKEDESLSRSGISTFAIGHNPKFPASPGQLSSASRRHTASTDCVNDIHIRPKNRISPAPAVQTGQSESFIKDIKRPSGLPSTANSPFHHSPIGLDQPFPTSPESPTTSFISPARPGHRRTASSHSSSTYEIGTTPPSVIAPPPSLPAQLFKKPLRNDIVSPSLSTVIPVDEPTHYEMFPSTMEIFGGGWDPTHSDYVDLSSNVHQQHQNAISNEPYMDLTRVNIQNTKFVSNSDYIKCQKTAEEAQRMHSAPREPPKSDLVDFDKPPDCLAPAPPHVPHNNLIDQHPHYSHL